MAQDRLKVLDNGQFYYAFKRVWANGAVGITFKGKDLIERLVALIPAPFKNLTRYHGVFAPRSRFKHLVSAKSQIRRDQFIKPDKQNKQDKQQRKKYYTMWAELMRKVFACDVLICPHCESTSSAVASISDHQIDVLECLINYDSRAPPK